MDVNALFPFCDTTKKEFLLYMFFEMLSTVKLVYHSVMFYVKKKSRVYSVLHGTGPLKHHCSRFVILLFLTCLFFVGFSADPVRKRET